MANDDLARQIIDGALLLQIGQRVIAIINARTTRGEFLPGSSTRGYSTKPAPMPYGGLAERIGKGTASRVFREISSEGGKVYRSKSGKIWMTLTGGYKRLRELGGRQSERVDLRWSGAMMSAIQAKTDPAVSQVAIYFTDRRSAEIAGFHHEGAGRSKIKRLFLGLTQEEREGLERWAEGEISRKFRFDFKA